MILLNNQAHKQIIEKLKDICRKDWDPIGVKEFEDAYDEYDLYISTLYNMIVQNKTEKEIFEYLLWIEKDHMNLSPQLNVTQKVAQKIYHLIPR